MALQKVELRRCAVARTFFPPATLQEAIDRLGFVQADPIRSPARAQDLILRHRAAGYRAGDLERHYPSLEVEEDYLYAYGFLSRRVWELLHPRKSSRLRLLEKKVLDVVRALGDAHPKALESHLGKRRVVNAWGGYSKATTSALEWLHWRGHLRIARRENGIRVYQASAPPDSSAAPMERLRALIMVYARIFAPSPEKSLQTVIARHRDLGDTRAALKQLVQAGELAAETVDGVRYVWPSAASDEADSPRTVRFLAPFDPLVWDRSRFELLWGWQYRFEAYTPVKNRVRGYYALPLLWGHDVIGWANAGLPTVARSAKGRARDEAPAGRLEVELGFVGTRPRGGEFRRELDAEIARLEQFLEPLTTNH